MPQINGEFSNIFMGLRGLFIDDSETRLNSLVKYNKEQYDEPIHRYLVRQ